MSSQDNRDIVKEAHEQVLRRRRLEMQMKDLKMRKDVAERRLAAYAAETAGNYSVWLGTPSQIERISHRLRQACTDNDVLMSLVNEVREKRESLTNMALCHYAKSCDH